MIRFRFLLLISLLLVPLAGHGGRQAPHPVAGYGIVIIPVASSFESLALYELPGIGPAVKVHLADVPTLAPSVTVKTGSVALAVMSVREGWLRIIQDTAGREAWVLLRDDWNYRPWERYLVGRSVRLEAGLKDPYYRFHTTPRDNSQPGGVIPPRVPLRVRSVDDDWIETVTASHLAEWFRWRDGDGRLLVTVQ